MLLNQCRVTRPPRLVQPRLQRTIETEQHVPALAGDRLNPVTPIFLGWRWTEVDVIGSVGVLLQTCFGCAGTREPLVFFDLEEDPVILQVPDFKDRFWVYAVYDERTSEFSKIGKPYGTTPGFYLVVGPDWKDETPDGITAVLRSPTKKIFAVPRIFMDSTEEAGRRSPSSMEAGPPNVEKVS